MQRLRFNGSGLVLSGLDYGGHGKPPLLFVHGGSAHGHWWDFVGPELTGRSHALALDQRGHGESEWAEGWAYGSRHYVDDLRAVIESWGLGAPVLVGHSMGGHNALLYAAAHSDKLRALVVVDSPPDYSQVAVNFLRSIAERPARKFATRAEAQANFKLLPRETKARPEVLKYIAERSFRQELDGSWAHKVDRRTLMREPLAVWDSLDAIACPTLVIKVSDSPVLNREAAKKMTAALPNGRMAEIQNSYHHVMLDNPTALVAVLKDFLATL